MFQLIDKQYLEETHEAVLTVEFDASVLPAARKQALSHLAHEVRLPGFRPGRVPENVLVRRLGKDVIEEAMVDALLEQSYYEIIEKAEIDPYANAAADVKVLGSDPMRLQLRVELAPVVELGDYKSLRVPYPEVEVTEEDVEKELDALRRRMALVEPVERPAQAGDAIELEVLEVHQEGDVLFHQHNVRLILDKDSGLPEAVVEALVGMSAGESKTLDVTVSEGDTSIFAKLVGHTLHFEMKVKQVNSYTLPDADDAFASTLGPFTSIEEVRRAIEHELWHHMEESAEKTYADAVLDATMSVCKVRIPPTMVKNVRDDHIEKLRKSLREKGVALEDVLQEQGVSLQDYMDMTLESARRDIARYLVLRKIYEQEHLDEEMWEWEEAEEEDTLYVELPEETETLEAENESEMEAKASEESDVAEAESDEAGDEVWDEDEEWDEDEAWDEDEDEDEADNWYDVTLDYLMDIASQED